MVRGNQHSLQHAGRFLYSTMMLVSLLIACGCSVSDDPSGRPGAEGQRGGSRGVVRGAGSDSSGSLEYGSKKTTAIGPGYPGHTANCIYCHPMNKSADNFSDDGGRGFFDLARRLNCNDGECLAPGGETPEGLFWSKVPRAARLVGVRCAACHGCQNGSAVSQIPPWAGAPASVLIGFSSHICGACHGRFAKYSGTPAPGPGPLSARCACCHNAQGFTYNGFDIGIRDPVRKDSAIGP